jgi:ligand-binding sensor domain-containing protein/serine phosphatase RsbU (regulator of sigma subunit)
MNKIVSILFLFVFLFSCTHNVEEKQHTTVKPNVKEAKGYIVPKDSIAEPKVIFVNQSKLKRIRAGKPKVVTTNLNVHPVGKPKIILAGNPKIIMPGTDTFSLPKVVPAIDRPLLVKHPKPTPALPFRMKDAATCNIQYLDVDQGMNSSYVLSILEDKRGNLWLGTNGGGVSKYDGKSFTHYTDKEGLSSNYVRAILEDKRGNIWFGTYGGGVSKYDGKSFTHYTDKEGLSNNTIRSLLEDKSGNIWFGSDGGGVSKYDGKSFTHYTEKEGLSNNTVLSMLEDTNGNIWFGTNGGGVSKYDGKFFVQYTDKEGLSNNTVWSMLEDKSGNIWFGTNGSGISKYDEKSFTHYTEKEGLNSNEVWSMLEDRRGNIWFGSYGGGVSKYDGKCFTNYTDKEGLSNNTVRSILEDKSGNLWFGTDGGGVSKYNGQSFRFYTEKEGLNSNEVWSILEDKSGNIWFGKDNGGVSKYDGKSFTHYTDKEGSNNNTILSLLKDKSGNLWLGKDGGGVSKYDGKFFTHYIDKDGLSCNTVLSILEDKSGNIWFGTDGGGVSKYDGKFFTHYTDKEGLSKNTILSMLEDKKGNLWFGTYGGGLTKYDKRSFTHYTKKEGLSNNTVLSMLEDKSGNIWFGTNGGGVCKYDGKFFTYYTDKEGLSNNTIWSILEDKSGNLWFSTEKGLNCFLLGEKGLKRQKSEEKNNPQIMVFHKEDGLKAEDFFSNSALLDSKNCIWWGSGKALSMLNMNEFELNEKEPEIQLENIYLQENFIDYRNLKIELIDSTFTNEYEGLKKLNFNDVAKFHNYPNDLELPYYLNHLTFQFSAIDWYAPHKLKYQYKLDGLDPDWSNLTPDNKADYRNIPFGKYIFKVRAIGSANKWSKTFEYSFVICPPWWSAWWAYLIYVFSGITIIILMIRWNGKRLRARAKELKIKVEEATLEIKEQKNLIEEKHKEITDSINYAERIQRSLLASKKLLDENLKDYFILFKPKDVVSGDFYWANKFNNNQFVLVCADSTGHGVPGAIMSILNIACLKEASLQGITSPDLLLNETRRLVIENLKNDGSTEGGKDGMDGSLLSFDFKNNILHCASANNPVWVIRNVSSSAVENKHELIEIKADRLPIGKHDRDNIPFNLHTLNLQKGDVVYLLTDGYPDQFGGLAGKKFKYKKLQELLLSIASESMAIQKQKLMVVFENWKGNLEQLDDVTIVGVRV